jgi:superfamily II DNA/RNA helicase
MSSDPCWNDPIGHETIKFIVKRCTPFTNGLLPHQLDLVTLVLDGEDVAFFSATGDGKSCAFSIPIIVLNEYNRNPELYPKGLRTSPRPVGIVITPTKGLANNIVSLKTIFVIAMSPIIYPAGTGT